MLCCDKDSKYMPERALIFSFFYYGPLVFKRLKLILRTLIYKYRSKHRRIIVIIKINCQNERFTTEH